MTDFLIIAIPIVALSASILWLFDLYSKECANDYEDTMEVTQKIGRLKTETDAAFGLMDDALEKLDVARNAYRDDPNKANEALMNSAVENLAWAKAEFNPKILAIQSEIRNLQAVLARQLSKR